MSGTHYRTLARSGDRLHGRKLIRYRPLLFLVLARAEASPQSELSSMSIYATQPLTLLLSIFFTSVRSPL